jgi:hypothetical protein
MMRPIVSFLLFFCAGCGATLHDAGQSAAQGAVAALTSPATQAALDKEGAAAVGAARDELLGPVTREDLQKLVAALSAQIRQQVIALRTDLFDANLRAEVAALREVLVGAPLREDLDALIDQAAPRLAAAIAQAMLPVKNDAQAAAKTWEKVALGVGGASAVLLLALGFAIWELRRHRRALSALLK